MRPKLETIGLEWATFQVLRRISASLSRKAKIDDKVSADQRGHGLESAWRSTPTAILSRIVKQ